MASGVLIRFRGQKIISVWAQNENPVALKSSLLCSGFVGGVFVARSKTIL